MHLASPPLLLALLSSFVNIDANEFCKSDEDFAQKPGAKVTSNGCSKPDFLTVAGEEDFTYCCDRHDACYGMCGAPKAYCDDDFKRCMLKLCSTDYKKNKQCPQAAEAYAMGTMMFGQEGYHDTQKQVCTCIDKTDMYNHYRSLVSTFYSEYAPEKADDAVELMDKFLSKHSDVSGTQPSYKYSKLYYNLHKKYDDAIVRSKGMKGKNSNKLEL